MVKEFRMETWYDWKPVSKLVSLMTTTRRDTAIPTSAGPTVRQCCLPRLVLFLWNSNVLPPSWFSFGRFGPSDCCLSASEKSNHDFDEFKTQGSLHMNRDQNLVWSYFILKFKLCWSNCKICYHHSKVEWWLKSSSWSILQQLGSKETTFISGHMNSESLFPYLMIATMTFRVLKSRLQQDTIQLFYVTH